MKTNLIINSLAAVCLAATIHSCAIPKITPKQENKSVPANYAAAFTDTTNSAAIKWREFFTDSNLVALIDTALLNNQELNIVEQEIKMAQNEVLAKKGAYLPFVTVGGGGGLEKVGRYTSQGASDEADEIVPGKKVPVHLPDAGFGISMSWEVDIWKKLHNAKDAAYNRFLASMQGRNFLVTQLVTEIASSYYELMALDNMLQILQQNIEVQQNALKIVKQQKQAAQVTELAVRKFEAELYKNQSHLYEIKQEIVEMNNKINFLVGRFPQPVQRNSQQFSALIPDSIAAGVPSQLLQNRADIQQAELELAATKLDVKAAKAEFYPSLKITASFGMQAFSPKFFINPQSIFYSIAGELMGPIFNRNAIRAEFLSANARQSQAAYSYERTILNAFTEVSTQLAMIDNLKNSYDLKVQQVDALNESVNIAINLFKSAKADYMEVLLTQRDALEARLEAVETKKLQMHAWVYLYKSLGGGWR